MDAQRHVERRRYGRVPVKYRAIVHFESGQDSQGTLLDLSFGGCRISSGGPATVGNVLEITIYPADEPEPIHVGRAVARWARDGEFGVEFVTVEAAQQERIRRLFAALAEELPG